MAEIGGAEGVLMDSSLSPHICNPMEETPCSKLCFRAIIHEEVNHVIATRKRKEV